MIVNTVGTTNKPSGIFECICGKTYKYDSGYYRHKKSCDMANAAAQGGTSDTEVTVIHLDKPLEKLVKVSKPRILPEKQKKKKKIMKKN